MRVLLADDHAMFRAGFIMLMEKSFPQLQWLQVSSWHEVHIAMSQHSVDLALLDLHMPSTSPWSDEIQCLLEKYPKLPVCVLSATTDPEVIRTAFQCGIRGYIPKLLDVVEFQSAFTAIIQGSTYIPQQLWETQPITNTYASVLTHRQQEVIQHIARGNSNKQIGKKLNLTESTVKRHLYNIFQVLGAKNRMEAVKYARQQGLLQ